jgi:uncharacterized protein YodC (DUF2158 family)
MPSERAAANKEEKGERKMQIGDIVRLKAGGPKMTVERLTMRSTEVEAVSPESGEVHCVWFQTIAVPCDGESEPYLTWGQLWRDSFLPCLLILDTERRAAR